MEVIINVDGKLEVFKSKFNEGDNVFIVGKTKDLSQFNARTDRIKRVVCSNKNVNSGIEFTYSTLEGREEYSEVSLMTGEEFIQMVKNSIVANFEQTNS